MAKSDGEDPYRVLGVQRDATAAEVATAYRSLARRFHPDLAGETATVQMMRINVAFDAIRDERRDAPEVPGRHPGDAGSGSAGRSSTATASTAHHTHHRPRRSNDGTGGAGPPPGRPSGSVLGFGRHVGWSIGEIARVDPGYLEWLEVRREGRPYLEEIDATLRRVRFRAHGTDGDGGHAKHGRRSRGAPSR